jgi:hypothetical protein
MGRQSGDHSEGTCYTSKGTLYMLPAIYFLNSGEIFFAHAPRLPLMHTTNARDTPYRQDPKKIVPVEHLASHQSYRSFTDEPGPKK